MTHADVKLPVFKAGKDLAMYEIILNGLNFGYYRGNTPLDAIIAMYRDAGYDGIYDDRLGDIEYTVTDSTVKVAGSLASDY